MLHYLQLTSCVSSFTPAADILLMLHYVQLTSCVSSFTTAADMLLMLHFLQLTSCVSSFTTAADILLNDNASLPAAYQLSQQLYYSCFYFKLYSLYFNI